MSGIFSEVFASGSNEEKKVRTPSNEHSYLFYKYPNFMILIENDKQPLKCFVESFKRARFLFQNNAAHSFHPESASFRLSQAPVL